ncbi:Nitrilase/cyanide hydratase and apolipoprotein N-acyltransferase [Acetohalobium arabaticum DSM 5501]|uniref:Nitrilase/cyanide hydratase and apolipoprotein N-acyltransferase n=1 Tax=Acetohalobium arabaticum (strain ATCC 49924 / DSM 5501 / Z-7288) TaxID=574087 RepID=D9QUU9_ACEAZ|nr:carbon-nitrogen family hydrolase [Acetohalobium arabaticum]ADL12008.1 Nitrilase/cyanide hydratase and apolipoprotein N-acyltransferase [Acetohalobium arabaticum DSM 5501]
MKVASLQLNISDDMTKQDRIQYTLNQMEQASDADLILLPEVWNIGYFSFNQYGEQSETLNGPSISAVAEKADELNSYVFAGSIVERLEGELYNTSVMLDNDGEILDTYRKIHLFGYGSAETEILTPGEEIVVIETEIGNLGFSTCYDLRFPELFRKMMKKGAEIFLVTSGWPFPRLTNWTALNQARAAENICYLVSCNCAGENQGTQFLGHSMIVDPWGTPIASSDHQERIVRAEIDVSKVKEIRQEFPPLKDRVLEV